MVGTSTQRTVTGTCASSVNKEERNCTDLSISAVEMLNHHMKRNPKKNFRISREKLCFLIDVSVLLCNIISRAVDSIAALEYKHV